MEHSTTVFFMPQEGQLMQQLSVVAFIISVAQTSNRQAYEELVTKFTEQLNDSIAEYEKEVTPREVENDPFPIVTRAVTDSVKQTIRSRMDGVRQQHKAALEEAAVIWRTRSEFMLRVQKAMEIAGEFDKKNGIPVLNLNEYDYKVLIQKKAPDLVIEGEQ